MPTNETVTMPPILIPYSRFSRGRQEAGESQARQDDMARQAAEQEKIQIDWTLSLRDKGMSAFRGANWKRGDLGKFLDLVDAGVIPKGSTLCIERVNRLSRMPWMRQVELWKDILSRGIVIRTCEPPARYTRENMDDLAVGCPVVIYMMLGYLESKQKSDWCRDAFRRMRERVRSEQSPHLLNCPAWVRQLTVPHPKDPERRQVTGYELDPGRVVTLRRIHELAWEGWGNLRIRNWLGAEDVKPWGKKGWTHSTVYYLLTSRTVVGEYQPQQLNAEGKPQPDGAPVKVYPAALTEEEYRRTQASLARRRGKGGRSGHEGGRVHLFSHILFDARDGRPMRAAEAQIRKNGRVYRYPNLTGFRSGWTMPEPLFERSVLFALSQLRARDVDGRHQANALSAVVTRLGNERSRLSLDLEALSCQLRELPAERWPARVVAHMADLEEAIRAKDAELQQASEAADVSTRTQALNDLQTSLERLDEIEEMPEGSLKEETRRQVRTRIKGRIPFLLESIWVRAQVESPSKKYVHVRMYLHGGEERPWVVTVGKPKGNELPLRLADFRAGKERGHALRPQLPA